MKGYCTKSDYLVRSSKEPNKEIINGSAKNNDNENH
jgi:hypothetical protein